MFVMYIYKIAVKLIWASIVLHRVERGGVGEDGD